MEHDPEAIPEFRITGLDGITELVIEPMMWPEPPVHYRQIVIRVIHKTTGYYRLVVAGLNDLYTALEEWPAGHGYDISDTFGRRGEVMREVSGHVDIRAWKPGRDRLTTRFRMTLEPEAVDRVVNFLDVVRRNGWEAALATRTE